TPISCFFFLRAPAPTQISTSFPTRRSSDLHGLAGAGRLQALQLVEGAVEGPFERGLVARERRERVRRLAEGGAEVGGQASFPQAGALPVEDLGLHAVEPPEPPRADDDALNQEGLQLPHGRQLGQE